MMLHLLPVIVCALSVHTACAATDPLRQCAPLPTMKKMTLQSVAANLDYNGYPMAIRRFSSAEDMQAVLAFYRGEWAGKGQGGRNPIQYPLQDWQVIAILQPPCFYTVQVRDFGQGSEGILAVTAPGAGKMTTVKEQVPMLPGSKLVNDISHNDPGKTARTLLLRNGFSVQANAEFYVRNLEGAGWRLVNNYQGGQHDAQGGTLLFKQGTREVSVAITQKLGNNSSVLINYVDQP